MDVCRSESPLKRSCYRGHGFEAHAHHFQLSAPIEMDQLLETLLQNSDSQVLAESLERLLDKQASDRDKNMFLEKSLDFGCHLQEAANKLTRQRATHHNYIVWPLTYDLTVKVFFVIRDTEPLLRCCYLYNVLQAFCRPCMLRGCRFDNKRCQ